MTKKARQKKKLRQDVSNKRYSRDYWSEDEDHGGTFIEGHIKRTYNLLCGRHCLTLLLWCLVKQRGACVGAS